MQKSQAHNLKLQLEQARSNTNGDIAYNFSKALINLPPGGALISYFLETYIKQPTNQRLENFLDNLIDLLIEIDNKVENLSLDSPTFQTALLSVFSVAHLHHQEQELEALRNIVVNAALPNAPEADIQKIFINWAGGFTTCHLMLLKYLDECDYDTFQRLRQNVDENSIFYNQVLQDLHTKNLILLREVYRTQQKNPNYQDQFSLGTQIFASTISSFESPYRDSDINVTKQVENITNIIGASASYFEQNQTTFRPKRVTDWGKLFLEFIKNPLEKISLNPS